MLWLLHHFFTYGYYFEVVNWRYTLCHFLGAPTSAPPFYIWVLFWCGKLMIYSLPSSRCYDISTTFFTLFWDGKFTIYSLPFSMCYDFSTTFFTYGYYYDVVNWRYTLCHFLCVTTSPTLFTYGFYFEVLNWRYTLCHFLGAATSAPPGDVWVLLRGNRHQAAPYPAAESVGRHQWQTTAFLRYDKTFY